MDSLDTMLSVFCLELNNDDPKKINPKYLPRTQIALALWLIPNASEDKPRLPIISRNNESTTTHLKIRPHKRAQTQIPQRAQMNPTQRNKRFESFRSSLRLSHCQYSPSHSGRE